MDGWAIGADVGGMLTGLSALTAASTWTAGRWRAWRQERAATRLRNWHGYIETGGINSWYVRLAEEPTEPTARVVLEVVNGDGRPNPDWANNLRQRVTTDGMLTRPPTPDEDDFLKALRKERGYGKGFPVGTERGEGGFWLATRFAPWPRRRSR